MELQRQAEDLAHLAGVLQAAEARGDPATTRLLEEVQERFEALWPGVRKEQTVSLVRRYRAALQAVGLDQDEAIALLGEHLFSCVRRLKWQPEHGQFVAWWYRVADRKLQELCRSAKFGRPQPIEAAPDQEEDGPPLCEVVLAALFDERVGSLWARYEACAAELLASANDPETMRARLLSFQWVDLEGLENRAVAAALGLAEYQCHRYRTWVRRELPKVFSRLFPELADSGIA